MRGLPGRNFLSVSRYAVWNSTTTVNSRARRSSVSGDIGVDISENIFGFLCYLARKSTTIDIRQDKRRAIWGRGKGRSRDRGRY